LQGPQVKPRRFIVFFPILFWWKIRDAVLRTVGSLSSGAALAQDESTKLAPHNNGCNMHVFPTVTRKGALPPQTDPGPLVNNGGPVMQGGAAPHLIFFLGSG
jgi:hypothetical protein